jgi:hypothetical protein
MSEIAPASTAGIGKFAENLLEQEAFLPVLD